ncbi:signal peptide peptidase-like 2B isoform X2 [Halichoerus grypus]
MAAAAAAAAAALARVAAAFLLLAAQVACEYGMVHVVSEAGGPKGKDYCILYNPQWAHLPHDLGKASLLQLRDWTASVLCSAPDLPAKGFSNQIPLVARGNCTFYEKVRLAQGGGARGLLIVSKEMLVPPGGNKTQYDEIGIPVALLSHKDMLDIFKSFGQAVRAALYAPNEPMLDYNMVIIFIMAVGTVALGGYWAGSRDVKKRYMKHKRDDGPEKQEDEAVDVSPVMICVFVVMCCSMLVLLYYFYDQLVYVIIGIFCLSSSTGLYSCLSPLVQRLPFGRCRVPDNSLPYFRKRPQVSMLLLALLCLAVSVVWGIFRNEDQWAWILQDALGVAFCLYMLKTIRLPTFKACTLLLLVLFVYDVFFVFITPFLTKSGNSIMVEVATGPSDSATHEKVPRLNASPLALCDRPFSLLGFGDILVPGLLVAYCHRFDIQVQSSRVYFVACTVGKRPRARTRKRAHLAPFLLRPHDSRGRVSFLVFFFFPLLSSSPACFSGYQSRSRRSDLFCGAPIAFNVLQTGWIARLWSALQQEPRAHPMPPVGVHACSPHQAGGALTPSSCMGGAARPGRGEAPGRPRLTFRVHFGVSTVCPFPPWLLQVRAAPSSPSPSLDLPLGFASSRWSLKCRCGGSVCDPVCQVVSVVPCR